MTCARLPQSKFVADGERPFDDQHRAAAVLSRRPDRLAEYERYATAARGVLYGWLKSCWRFRDIWCEQREWVLPRIHVALFAMPLMPLRIGLRPINYALMLLGTVLVGSPRWAELGPFIERCGREPKLEWRGGRRSGFRRRGKC